MARLAIKVGGLVGDLAKFKDAISTFPAGAGNPLILWRKAYGLRTIQSSRPTVGASGSFRGNSWPAVKPQYTRKDGTIVPVWGGIPRLRAGHVTRAGKASQRYLKYMSPAQIEGGATDIGVVKVGQTFTAGNVLGKLRRDGTRYRQSDKQLSTNAEVGLLGDFAKSEPILGDNNRLVRILSNRSYAVKVHEKRPFAFGGAIDKEESDSLLAYCSAYVDGLLKKLDSGGH